MNESVAKGGLRLCSCEVGEPAKTKKVIRIESPEVEVESAAELNLAMAFDSARMGKSERVREREIDRKLAMVGLVSKDKRGMSDDRCNLDE
jgi:hypothetical protein